MAQEKVYSIRIDGVDTAVNSINDLEQGVKTLDEKLKGTKIGSAEFKALQKELAKAKSGLKDFELQVEGLDKEQRATALVDSFNGLTGAVGAVSSAFIAFGADSGAIEEAEKKLLGVIGVVSGLRDASNGIIAAQKLLAASNITLGASFKKAFSGGVKGAQALKGALISTGIGALVVAVGLLIQYWDEFVDLLGLGASEGQKNLDIAKQQTTEAQSQLDATNASTELLKQQGLSDREILELKIKQTNEVITALEAQLTAQQQIRDEQIATAQRNQSILQGILRFLTAPLELLLRTIDAIGSAFGEDFGLAEGLLEANEALAGTIFSGDTTELDEGIEDTKKQLLTLKNARAGYQNQITAEDEKGAEDRKKVAEDAAAKEKQAILDAEKAKRDLLLAQQKETLGALKQTYDNKLADIAEAQAKELEQENLTEAAKMAIREKYDNERLLALEEYNDGVIAENARLAAEQEELDNATKDAKQATDASAKEDLIKTATATYDTIIALTEAFGGKTEEQQKRAFNIAKKAQLAQAIISGIAGVQNAYKSAQDSPLTPLFPAYPYIQAALAGAFALANIKKIQATQFGGGGGGEGVKPSGGASRGNGSSVGSLGGVNQGSLGNPNMGNIMSGGGQQQQPAVKAYVLAGDVVDGVNANNKINQRRTL